MELPRLCEMVFFPETSKNREVLSGGNAKLVRNVLELALKIACQAINGKDEGMY